MNRPGSAPRKAGDGRGRSERSQRIPLTDSCLRWFYRLCRWNLLKICIVACCFIYVILWSYGFPFAADTKATRVFASTKDLRKRMEYVFSDISEVKFTRSEVGENKHAVKQKQANDQLQLGTQTCTQSPPLPLVYGDFFDLQLSGADIQRGWIPRIIHQTWKTEQVPERFVPYVQSWSALHLTEESRKARGNDNNWLHILWTDKTMHAFMKRYAPSLMPIYDASRFGVTRSDIFRLLVLAKFGGVYADVDVEALRPLTEIVNRHACMIASEPTLHAVGVLERLFFPSNSVMACRANHPLFNYLIEKLPELMAATRDDEDKIVFKAGPEAVNAALRAYAALDNFIDADGKRELEAVEAPCAEDAVYVPSGHLFMPLSEPRDHFFLARARCRKWMLPSFRQTKLRAHVKGFCELLLHKNFVNRVTNVSYTVHHWASTYRTAPSTNEIEVDIEVNLSPPEKPVSEDRLVNILDQVRSLLVLDVDVESDRLKLERASRRTRPPKPVKKPKSDAAANASQKLKDWVLYGHLFRYDDVFGSD